MNYEEMIQEIHTAAQERKAFYDSINERIERLEAEYNNLEARVTVLEEKAGIV